MTDTQGHAEFYDMTRRLLIDAKARRNLDYLRRAKDRIDGERFKALSDERQQDLLELLSAATLASGMGAA